MKNKNDFYQIASGHILSAQLHDGWYERKQYEGQCRTNDMDMDSYHSYDTLDDWVEANAWVPFEDHNINSLWGYIDSIAADLLSAYQTGTTESGILEAYNEGFKAAQSTEGET